MPIVVGKNVSFIERFFYNHLYQPFVLRNFFWKAVLIKNKKIEKDIGQAQEEIILNSG